MYNHIEYIKSKLEKPISKKGVIEIGKNLNDYLPFDVVNEYAKKIINEKKFKPTTDAARQEKSRKDAIMGRIVEEVIAYLLAGFFSDNKCNFFVTHNDHINDTIKEISNTLGIERIIGNITKQMDSDIIIYNKDNYKKTRKVFVLSTKGSARERIGQFLSHLFLMDQDVLNVKYGKSKYEVIFVRENIKVKYAFVTFDWAKNPDLNKFTEKRKDLRKGVKVAETFLINDDKNLSGGIYVFNNRENIDGIGNFTTLAGTICDYLK